MCVCVCVYVCVRVRRHLRIAFVSGIEKHAQLGFILGAAAALAVTILFVTFSAVAVLRRVRLGTTTRRWTGAVVRSSGA
jgi:hypothetical protein